MKRKQSAEWRFTIRLRTLAVLPLLAFRSALPIPSNLRPPISWSEKSIQVVVSPGAVAERLITFTSSEPLSDITVQAVPELSGMMSLSPSMISSIPSNIPQSIRLIIAPGPDKPTGTYEGTIHIRSGRKTVPNPLPVVINVWKQVTTGDIQLNYPPSFAIQQDVLALGGPIALNNFGGAFAEGGIVPSGGAEINVATAALGSLTVDQSLAQDLIDVTITTSQSTVVDGNAGKRVTYSLSIGGNLMIRTVAIYVPKGGILYKFFLNYRAGDSRENEFLNAFQAILNTARLI